MSSSSMHRVILIFSSGVSWAILDALQTNYAVGSLAREKWNVWTVTIALLPVIVNFCEASVSSNEDILKYKEIIT